MKFNPDNSKHATEVIFSHKRKPPVHHTLLFNDIHVKRDMDKIKTANKGLGLLKFLSKDLTRGKFIK